MLIKTSPKKYKLVANQIFGKWTVVDGIVYRKSNNRAPLTLVICECGLKKFIRVEHLLNERSKACNKCKVMPRGSANKNWKGVGKISKTLFWRIKYEAQTRNIEFNLTIKYIANLFNEQNEQCALTGKKLTFGTKGRKDYYTNTTASLDRIDSSKGYIKGNVQWVHKKINLAKRDMSDDQFIMLCQEVIQWKNKILIV